MLVAEPDGDDAPGAASRVVADLEQDVRHGDAFLGWLLRDVASWVSWSGPPRSAAPDESPAQPHRRASVVTLIWSLDIRAGTLALP